MEGLYFICKLNKSNQRDKPMSKLPQEIKIGKKLSTNIPHLMEEVSFPVVVMKDGTEELRVMRSTRFDCVKHNLEMAEYSILQFRGDHDCLIMLKDGSGSEMGDEKADGEFRHGKSVASLITGNPNRFHYKDNDVMNNLQANFETRAKQKKLNW